MKERGSPRDIYASLYRGRLIRVDDNRDDATAYLATKRYPEDWTIHHGVVFTPHGETTPDEIEVSIGIDPGIGILPHTRSTLS